MPLVIATELRKPLIQSHLVCSTHELKLNIDWSTLNLYEMPLVIATELRKPLIQSHLVCCGTHELKLNVDWTF
ncbi:hypothetical protein CEXT_770961 [Caerostris extrusa]|uniref:Uncharacterized protein n=1 Tax=Caerostris extrusa TaxID=172846 RepID=A0AAV4TXI1_CAEEX|nr:hypothetical protein CEXT_770961 [Caerostris extrusa]